MSYPHAPRRVWRPVQHGQSQRQEPVNPTLPSETRMTPTGAQPFQRGQTTDVSHRPMAAPRPEQATHLPQSASDGAVGPPYDLQQADVTHMQRPDAPGDGTQRTDQLLKVQTSLASDLRLAIDCDAQIERLAQKKSSLLTQILSSRNHLSKRQWMTNAKQRKREKTSRSPPYKQQKIDPQQLRPSPQPANTNGPTPNSLVNTAFHLNLPARLHNTNQSNHIQNANNGRENNQP